MKSRRKGQTAAAMRRATGPCQRRRIDADRGAQQRQFGGQAGQQPLEGDGGAAGGFRHGGAGAVEADHQVDRAFLQVQPAIGQRGDHGAGHGFCASQASCRAASPYSASTRSSGTAWSTWPPSRA